MIDAFVELSEPNGLFACRQSNPALIQELFLNDMQKDQIPKPYLRIYTTWIDGFARRGDCENVVKSILYTSKANDQEQAINPDKQWIQHHLGKAIRNRRRLLQLSPPALKTLEEWGIDLQTPNNPTLKVLFAMLVALVEIMERPSAVALLDQLKERNSDIQVPTDVTQYVRQGPKSAQFQHYQYQSQHFRKR